MQTIPHVRTDSMGIPREQKVHVNRLRLISRAGPPQRCSDTTAGVFTRAESRPGFPGSTLERRRPGKPLYLQGRIGRRSLCFASPVICCPSETGLCAPAHELPSRYVGRRDAQPSLQMRKMTVTYRNLNWLVSVKHGVQVSRHHYNKYKNVRCMQTATGWRYTTK